MVTARRIPNGYLHFLVGLVLLLAFGGWQGVTTAQSPVAEQLPIKSVRVYERLCPASVDPSAGTWQDARTACPDVAAGMVFTLTSGNPSYPQVPLTVNAQGQVEWPEVRRAPVHDRACGSSSLARPGLPAGSPRVSILCGSGHRANLYGTRALNRDRRRRTVAHELPAHRMLLVRCPEDRGFAGGAGLPRSHPGFGGWTSGRGGGAGSAYRHLHPTRGGGDTTNAGVQAEPNACTEGSPESSAITPPDTSIANTTNAGALADPDAGAHVDIQL